MDDLFAASRMRRLQQQRTEQARAFELEREQERSAEEAARATLALELSDDEHSIASLESEEAGLIGDPTDS